MLFFLCVFFLPVFPIRWITLAASSPFLQWVLFPCDTWCLVPLRLAVHRPLGGTLEGWGFRAVKGRRVFSFGECARRARPGVPVPALVRSCAVPGHRPGDAGGSLPLVRVVGGCRLLREKNFDQSMDYKVQVFLFTTG